MDETEDNLESVSSIEGPERAQVVADVEADLDRLEAAYDLLIGSTRTGSEVLIPTADPTGEIRLQASWENGSIVVWAGGPDMVAHKNADLADRLEALGGPSLGWAVHADVTLPNGLQRRRPVDPRRGGTGLAGRRRRRWSGRRGRRRRERPLAGASRRRGGRAGGQGPHRAQPADPAAPRGQGHGPERALVAGPGRRRRHQPARRRHARPGRGALAQGPAHGHARGDRRRRGRDRAGGGREARAPGHAAGDPQRRRRRRGLRRPPRRLAVPGADPRRRRGVEAARPVGATR